MEISSCVFEKVARVNNASNTGLHAVLANMPVNASITYIFSMTYQLIYATQ